MKVLSTTVVSPFLSLFYILVIRKCINAFFAPSWKKTTTYLIWIVYIYLKDGREVFFYGKLNDVEKELAGNKQRYLRIHQSYLVNYDYVSTMNFSSLVIENGGKSITLQISEDRQKKIRKQLCDLASKKAGGN